MKLLTLSRETSQEQTHGSGNDTYSTSHSSTGDLGASLNDPFLLGLGYDDPSAHPSSRISQAIELYFQYCHRQPIWCFGRAEVKDPSYISEELVCSILTLTARFSQERDEMQHYGDTARTLVMLRIANGSVELETLESLCLLSYSSFLGRSASQSPGLCNALTSSRWKCAPGSVSPRPGSSTVSLRDARRQLNLRR